MQADWLDRVRGIGGFLLRARALHCVRFMRTQQISFQVQGMYCARCAVQLEQALARLDGIYACYVNYASERATVLCEPARVRAAALVGAVRSAGFEVAREEEMEMVIALNKRHKARRVISWRRILLPSSAGLLGGLALVGLYLAILSLAQSPSHALEQLSQDRFWVALVALGFGIQIGLYTYLRLIISAMMLAGATAMTGAGTTTSTVGMIACCAHHLADLAPLLGLAGASALSPVVTFLAEWKIPFILFGLAVNVIAIGMSLRLIRRERAHLKMMERNAASNADSNVKAQSASAPACH